MTGDFRTAVPPVHGFPKDANINQYLPLIQIAEHLRAGQVEPYESAAREFDSYRGLLYNTAEAVANEQPVHRFRRFSDWEGDSAGAAESALEQHQKWLVAMAETCGRLAAQAADIAQATREAIKNHPTPEQIRDDAEEWARNAWLASYYWRMGELLENKRYKKNASRYAKKMASHQKKSDEVLKEYKAHVPSRLSPSSSNSGLFDVPDPDDLLPDPDDLLPDPDDLLPDPDPGLDLPDDGLTPDSEVPDALPTADELGNSLPAGPTLPTGPTLKPASVGAGGAGGAPSMPLAPREGGSVAQTPALGASGRGSPAVGGAAGGRMMGMPPMMPPGAPGAKDQNSAGGKHRQEADESLYTEDRPWTEGFIGRRKNGQDSK